MNKHDQIFIGFLIAIVAVAAIFTYFAIENRNIKGDAEWSNNATLIAEVGVGIVITMVVLMITKLSESKMNHKISSIQLIVRGEVVDKLIKRKDTIQELRELLILITSQATIFFMHLPKGTADDNLYNEQILHGYLDSLKGVRFENTEYFSNEEIKKIKEIGVLASVTFEGNLSTELSSKVDDLNDILKQNLDKIRKEIDRETKRNVTDLEDLDF